MLRHHFYQAKNIDTGSIVVIPGDIVAVWDRKSRLAMWKDEEGKEKARQIRLDSTLQLLHTPLTLAHQFLSNVKFGYELNSDQETALAHLRVRPNTTDAQKEYILCAAVWWDDSINTYVHQPINIKTGFVVTGHRHHNCFTIKAMLTGINAFKSLKPIQGFLTNTNRFVDRIEASVIAYDAKQIKSMVAELKSEDLY